MSVCTFFGYHKEGMFTGKMFNKKITLMLNKQESKNKSEKSEKDNHDPENANTN